jgi:hypothetical protein
MASNDTDTEIKIRDTHPESSDAHGSYRGFNGGKMAHIFEFDKDTGLYAETIASAEAEAALQRGKVFYKIDGSNGMLIRGKNGELTTFQRLDTRGRPTPEVCVSLPQGPNADVYEGHSYCYKPISANVEGKKAKKMNQAMLDLVDKYKDHLLCYGEFVSIEWVGAKFNKTPGVPHDIAIAIHVDQSCNEEFDHCYEGLRNLLLRADTPIEGLIFEFSGVYWKVRADCFDRNCPFKTNRPFTRSPIFLA